MNEREAHDILRSRCKNVLHDGMNDTDFLKNRYNYSMHAVFRVFICLITSQQALSVHYK